MLTVRRRLREFQIGMWKQTVSGSSDLVVFDPLAQKDRHTDKHIVLFDGAEQKIGNYRAEIVWELLDSPDMFSESQIDSVIDAYCRAAEIDLESEWRTAQRAEAGLSFVTADISTYAALRNKHAGGYIPYIELLCTTEWLERRAAILAHDGARCVNCSAAKTDGCHVILQVHHKYYVRKRLPWEYPDDALATMCKTCHQELHDNVHTPVYDEMDGKWVPSRIRVCIRCLGAGYFPQYQHVEGGICFRCHGGQFEPEIFAVQSGQVRLQTLR